MRPVKCPMRHLIQVPYSCINPSLPFSPAAQIDNRQYPPQSAQNQASQGLSNLADGSGPIFSMYMEMVTEEDKRMTDAWKADADGILIFVRRYILTQSLIYANSPVIDRIILRCCRIVDLSVHSGHSTESSGHFQFLPREYLSSDN